MRDAFRTHSAGPSSGRGGRRHRAAPAFALCALALLALAAAARAAEPTLCSYGSAAGQCTAPTSVATDFTSGRSYVVDVGNQRIDVFSSGGVSEGSFGAEGSLGGQLKLTESGGSHPYVAVNNDATPSPSFHDVFVYDNGNNRVERFHPNGEFVLAFGWNVNRTAVETGGATQAEKNLCTAASEDVCRAGIAGSSAGQFRSGLGTPKIALGPGGVVYAVDNVGGGNQRLQRFTNEGAPIGAPVSPLAPAGELGNAIKGVAVTSGGDFYAASNFGNGAVRRYDETGAPVTACGGDGAFEKSYNIRTLALDQSGDLFVADAIGTWGFAQYNPACEEQRVIYGAEEHLSEGLAAPAAELLSAEGTGEASRVSRVPFPPPGPVLLPGTTKAPTAHVGSARATLEAKLNPEGAPVGVRFQYIDQQSWEEEGEAFAGPGLKTSEEATPVEELTGSSEPYPGEPLLRPYKATLALSGLAPETTYRFRALAREAGGEEHETVGPEGAPFTTREPLEILAAWSGPVGTGSATVHAEVNPLGTEATGYFEYVTEAEYKAHGFEGAAEAPDVGGGAEPLDFGAGEEPLERATALSPLSPGTAYRYRIVLHSHCKPDPEIICAFSGVAPSGEAALATFSPLGPAPPGSCPANEAFRTGPAALLPDCRAYEMVSPVDKAGGDIRPLVQEFTGLPVALDQSALSGQRMAYGTYRAFGDAPSAPYNSEYVARRDAGAGEWVSHSVNPPRGESIEPARLDGYHKAFSPDLCEAWIRTDSEPPLATGAVAGFANLYRRTDEECGGPSYQALSTAAPPDVEPRRYLSLELQGLSADGAAALFIAPDSLPGTDAPPQPSACVSGHVLCEPELYVHSPSGLAFACILPSGAAAATCSAGGPPAEADGFMRQASVQGAISTDGSRVFWSDEGTGEGKIYLRQNPAAPESARAHGAASGTGTVIGPAEGTGKATIHKEFVSGVALAPESGPFAVGQEITDSAGKLPAATKIVEIEVEKEEAGIEIYRLILDQEASGSKPGDELTGLASATVPALSTQSGAFEADQSITGPGIAPGTTVRSCSPSCDPGAATSLTLSALATATHEGAALAASSPCTEAAARACTVAVSKAGEAASGTSASSFLCAAQDGSRAIYATGSELYEARSAEAGGDLAVSTEPIAGQVSGAPPVSVVAGCSADASRVYFASREAIASAGANSEEDEALPGKPNLYLYEAPAEAGEEPRYAFVTTLSETDVGGNRPYVTSPRVSIRTSRVSPDGGHLAFMSAAGPLSEEEEGSRRRAATTTPTRPREKPTPRSTSTAPKAGGWCAPPATPPARAPKGSSAPKTRARKASTGPPPDAGPPEYPVCDAGAL